MSIKQLFFLVIASLFFLRLDLKAHPMPYSVLLLDVRDNGISAELQIPLKELQSVFPNKIIDTNYTNLIEQKNKWVNDYLLSHIIITDTCGNKWKISIHGKSILEDEQNLTGKYRELIFQLWLEPPIASTSRHFIMYYDAIMHQLVTHKLWIKVRSDWESGILINDSNHSELGILGVNFTDNSIPPVIVNLDDSSNWRRLWAMVSLGIEHISEGTDHILFLLVLLLPAPLIVEKKRWTTFGGTKYSIARLIKITTAFTIGHSITLIISTMNWVRLPQQPVEIIIGITILLTAIHALLPIFYNKEIYVASGFGLIHGLAFATVLSNLHLQSGNIAIYIIGFNCGIELMQIFIILLVVPWLIILSDKPLYKYIRIIGTILAIIASIGWIIERILLHPNFITIYIANVAKNSKWIALFLACIALISLLKPKFKIKRD